MPGLRAFLEAQRHRHVWAPLSGGEVALERCECGAVRQVEPDDEAEPESEAG